MTEAGRVIGVALLGILLLGVTSCGEEAPPAVERPVVDVQPSETPNLPPAMPWPELSREQHDEAERLGVPVRFENDLRMRFVLIPAGTFRMGSPDSETANYEHAEVYHRERPQHEVTLAGAFYVQTTEVTNAQYRQFRAHGWGVRPQMFNRDDQPVVASHDDATAFLRWLSGRSSGRTYRLPNEAEWEYACRAGTTTRFWPGDTERDLEAVEWYFRNAGLRLLPWSTSYYLKEVVGFVGWGCRTHPVGWRQANPWGLHDMHGNIAEWCNDTWHASYEGAPTDGSAWVDQDSDHRVLRGGSWYSPAEYARSAWRGSNGADARHSSQGFRLVSPLPEEGE